MSQVRQTHLEYYREHKIAPVRYDLSKMDSHLERRLNLYSKLSLLPLTFANAKVLEVAAGTGHNSLYLAQCLPAELVLLEPNSAGVQHIKEVYNNFELPHTAPIIIEQTLEEYNVEAKFDIVLCENWLGTSNHERLLLSKLGKFVKVGGVLVVTTISPVAFVPNLLRRFLSIYLAPPEMPFAERTNLLIAAFSSHLKTLTSMTRNNTDWVQDNMMNPAYFGLCLSIPILLTEMGNNFNVLSSSPLFAEDWRWFKALHGESGQTNEHFLMEYWKKSHNFLDYRADSFLSDMDRNKLLEEQALLLLLAVAEHEDAYLNNENLQLSISKVVKILNNFIMNLPSQLTSSINALKEVQKFIESPELITVSNIAAMSEFPELFGRETAYVSMMRSS